MDSAPEETPLSVRSAFAGQHVFVTGVTGFVGKVLLAMMAVELRQIRRISVLVRRNKQYSDVDERFDAVVALSEPFQEVARRVGNDALQAWIDDVINVPAAARVPRTPRRPRVCPLLKFQF